MGYYTRFEVDIYDISSNVPAKEVLDSFKYLLCQADENYEKADGSFYESSIFTDKVITEDALLDEVICYLKDAGEIKGREEFPSFMFKEGAGIKIFQALCEYPENISAEEMKWYEWKEDMKRLSSISNNIVWIVSGEGEESGDMWKAYFKGGKVQEARAVVTYDDYDEGKLE